MDLPSQRKIEELPWQLRQAREWQRLFDLLSNQAFFEAAWPDHEFDVKSGWVDIMSGCDLRLLDAYRSLLEHPRTAPHAWNVANLLSYFGHIHEAVDIQLELAEQFLNANRLDAYAQLISNISEAAYQWGKLDEALQMQKEVEEICRALDDDEGLAHSLGNQAVILKEQGKLTEASNLAAKQEDIAREMGQLGQLHISYGTQALIAMDRGDWQKSQKLLELQEKLCRQIGDLDGLQACLGNQSLVFEHQDDLNRALELAREKERICRSLGNQRGLATCLIRLANLLGQIEGVEAALPAYRELERISRQLDKTGQTMESLAGRSFIQMRDASQFDEVEQLLEEHESLARSDENHDAVARNSLLRLFLNVQRSAAGQEVAGWELDAAQRLEETARQNGDKTLLANCLWHKADAQRKYGQVSELITTLKEIEQLAIESDDPETRMRCLGCQATVAGQLEDDEAALDIFHRFREFCRQRKDANSLHVALGLQANFLKERGQLNEALQLHREEEAICRQLDDSGKADLQVALNNQAGVLAELGRYHEAIDKHCEEARICRELGEQHGLMVSLAGCAAALEEVHDYPAAVTTLEETTSLARMLGDPTYLANALLSQARIFTLHMKRRREARPMVEEVLRIARENDLPAFLLPATMLRTTLSYGFSAHCIDRMAVGAYYLFVGVFNIFLWPAQTDRRFDRLADAHA